MHLISYMCCTIEDGKLYSLVVEFRLWCLCGCKFQLLHALAV